MHTYIMCNYIGIILPIILTILVIFFIILALYAKSTYNIIGGRDDDNDSTPAPIVPKTSPSSHILSNALQQIRIDQFRDLDFISDPHPRHIINSFQKKIICHGGATKKDPLPKKPWTQYNTWKALYKDKGAHIQYLKDVAKSLNTLDLDWSEVRKYLANIVYDNREWAGRINYVKGQLKVVECVPSPYAVGEGPLSRQDGAMVPAKLMKKLIDKPGLFLLHTHPGEEGGSTSPSAIDMAGAMSIAYTGRYAGEVMASPYGIFLYTPSNETRQRVWSAEDDDPYYDNKAYLTMLRAFDGARSWTTPWTLNDYEELARRYGIEYVVFPNDKYIHQYHRLKYSSLDEVDHNNHQEYIARIKELEGIAKSQNTVAISK